GVGRIRCVDQAAAVGVREANDDLVGLDGRQGVQQIVDVEADLDFLAFVGDFDLVFGFFLLRVVRLECQKVRPGGQADAAILFVRQDGGALQRLAQNFTIRLDSLRRAGRDYASVLRETSVNELRCEANVADLGANVISANSELDIALGAQD